ncbi:tetraspanin-9-like [Dendronephthya gigantea]|uniref:tetraspanin-9-like n=1 Tax=Dendronephthya gigantea TaxID=151771 RepID=UPI00106D83C3|nr:tetraspanin-9-like [Dendronephthya gigantea]
MGSQDEGSTDTGNRRSRTNLMRVPFFIINILTWIGGGALIGFAIWIVASENEYKHFIENQNIFIAYITLAAVLFTAGILGTCGVLLGNKVLLQGYFFVICLVFCTLFGLVVFGVVERSRMDQIVRDSWNKTNDDTRIFIQEKFDCCDVGINNTKTDSNKHESCFVNNTKNNEVKQDCLSKLIEWFEDHQIALATGGAAVMMVLILLMVGSCWLIRKFQTTQRTMKVSRVAPAAQNDENDMDHTYAQPFKNRDGQMNEMVSIEEPQEESYSNGNERGRKGAKTAKHQRNAWAKKSSNSPMK